jgi:hypothetical protein
MMNLNRQHFVARSSFEYRICSHELQNTSNIKISLHLSEQMNVKILFIDDHAGLQEKWIEPLRGEGWGVLRTKSTQDAEKVFEFHGDSIHTLIVSEKFADWASQWNFPYIVLLTHWKELQVMKHQNASQHPATHYLDFDSNLDLLKQAVTESKGRSRNQELKPTGSDSSSVAVINATQTQPVGGDIELGFSHASSASGSDEKETSPKEGVVIQLEQYAGQKSEIEAKPAAKDANEAPKDTEATVILNLTEGVRQDVSSDVLSFLNDDSGEQSIEEKISEPDSVELEIVQDETMPSEDATQMAAIEQRDAEGFSDDVMELHDSEDEFEEQNDFEEIAKIDSIPESSTGQDKDIETMKNYLALREQDVAVLTGQLRSSQERMQQLENLLKVEKARSAELSNSVQKQDQQIKSFERDKQVEFEVMYQQIEDLNLQLRERTDKTRTIETKLKIMTDEVEKVKERVRLDLRRIRVREKELENQLEILKKDSTALLVARDEKIVELKRKIDLLEFNMELVQEQYGKERNLTDALRQKLKDAAGAVKRAGGLLDQEN